MRLNHEHGRTKLVIHPNPRDDEWRFLYGGYRRFVRPHRHLDRVVRSYFLPSRIEEWDDGRLYRMLGVHRFGRWIPTGGAGFRRLTGWRMAPYTLTGISIDATREFFYRACVFELLHLPFALTMVALTVRAFLRGRPDLALEDLIVNLVANVYPIMHHRYTRARIARVLRRVAQRERLKP